MGSTHAAIGFRGRELEEIDRHLERYEHATSDYGRDWEVNELRIALEAWKKKVGSDWQKSTRNGSGAFTALDRTLTELGHKDPLPESQDADLAAFDALSRRGCDHSI